MMIVFTKIITHDVSKNILRSEINVHVNPQYCHKYYIHKISALVELSSVN